MGKFPRIYNIDYSQDPDGLGEGENRAGELQRPDHLYVHVQRHREDKELHLERREGQELFKEVSTRTLDFLWSRFGKEMVRWLV